MNWKVPTRLTNEYTKAAQGRATNPDKTGKETLGWGCNPEGVTLLPVGVSARD